MSLGRNNTNNLNELEVVGDTLEELWIPYNFIEKLKGTHVMKELKILYMSNNLVKDWAEFVKLAELPCLEDLVFVGNPLEEKHSAEGIDILIIDELAMEAALEGNRFGDLIRFAERRGEPEFLAKRVASRKGKENLDEELYNKLMDKENWYLPLK